MLKTESRSPLSFATIVSTISNWRVWQQRILLPRTGSRICRCSNLLSHKCPTIPPASTLMRSARTNWSILSSKTVTSNWWTSWQQLTSSKIHRLHSWPKRTLNYLILRRLLSLASILIQSRIRGEITNRQHLRLRRSPTIKATLAQIQSADRTPRHASQPSSKVSTLCCSFP